MEEKKTELQPTLDALTPETKPETAPEMPENNQSEIPGENPQETPDEAPQDGPNEELNEKVNKTTGETPNEQPGELHEKKVFTDIFSTPRHETADLPITPHTAEPSFFESITLDLDYAARNPAAPKTPAVQRAPVTPRTPAAPRAPVVRTPAAPVCRTYTSARPRAKKLLPALRTMLRTFFSVRLCSGERPGEALRRIVRQSCALLLVCLIIGGVLWTKHSVTERMTNNGYESLAKSTVYSEPAACLGFSVESADLPDGYALAQALCIRLGSPITDTSVFDKSAEEPVFPDEVAACMESVLPPDRVVLQENISNLDLLTQIHESISAGNPVIVLLSEADAPELSLRYAAVTRMNVEQDRITVEFTNTGTRTYSFEDFIAATRFENTGDLPYTTELALDLGVWSPNTAVFVH